MSFSMHDFIMNGLRDAVGKLPDYKIVMNSIAWFEKGTLTESDLAELQILIDEKNMPEPEETLEEETELEPAP